KNRTGKIGKPRAVNAKPARDTIDDAHDVPPRSRWRIVGLVAIAALVISGLALLLEADGRLPLPAGFRAADTSPAPTFAGSEACTECHQTQAALWRQSQHRHAMQRASTASVLGDFENAGFDYYGVHSRFFKKDGKYLVETDGPDGTLATFEVKYTFGIDPLQQ